MAAAAPGRKDESGDDLFIDCIESICLNTDMEQDEHRIGKLQRLLQAVSADLSVLWEFERPSPEQHIKICALQGSGEPFNYA